MFMHVYGKSGKIYVLPYMDPMGFQVIDINFK